MEYRKRCKRHDIPGQAHYLTFSCFSRQPFLRGQRACGRLADAITRARLAQPFALWAYVFMPEHVHLLLLPAPGVIVSAILKEIKQPVAVWVLEFVRREAPDFLPCMAHVRPNGLVSHRFWLRGGGYDRNLWTPNAIHEKIRYIHANPVRRGLAESPNDWRWSSWRAWEGLEDGPILLDKVDVPPVVL